jgi:hypothetical protein
VSFDMVEALLKLVLVEIWFNHLTLVSHVLGTKKTKIVSHG